MARRRAHRPEAQRRIRTAAAAALLASTALATLGACASSGRHAERHGWVDNRGVVRTGAPATLHRDLTTLVAPTGALLAWERSDSAPAVERRFEYDRRTAALNPRRAAALRATLQWPEPLGPPERPVRFRRWEQD